MILDGVFNHTSPKFFAFQDIVAHQEHSAYKDWYYIRQFPLCQEPHHQNYKCFGYYWGMPKLNLRCPAAAAYFTEVALYWLREAGVDGWRLDVGDEISHEFWRGFRKAIKAEFPQALIVGEIWHHAPDFLQGDQWDSVMNYPFKNAVLDFVKGKPAEQAMTEILTICEHYPAPAMDTALNFLSTHDTERALTVIADEPANGRGRAWQSGRCVTGDAYEEGLLRLRMAYAIIYTLPGVPCLYYGDEIGMQGYRDPFNRAFFCWDSHEERLRPVLAQLAQLRHSCEAFRTGELRVLRAEDGILHYQRIGKTETAEIIVNRSEHIIVEPLASGKHTEVNPMGFTIVVEENGHNPNHSYYDIQ